MLSDDSGLIDRFMCKVDTSAPSGCWLWKASVTRAGYGQFRKGNRMLIAHRFSYELFVGPIPEGLTLDHLCRIRRCVNPSHLEPVTQRENTMRGETVNAANARKLRCSKCDGRYTVEKSGFRRCRRCSLERDRRRRAARRAAAAALSLASGESN